MAEKKGTLVENVSSLWMKTECKATRERRFVVLRDRYEPSPTTAQGCTFTQWALAQFRRLQDLRNPGTHAGWMQEAELPANETRVSGG